MPGIQGGDTNAVIKFGIHHPKKKKKGGKWNVTLKQRRDTNKGRRNLRRRN